jgi:hypothetical protein
MMRPSPELRLPCRSVTLPLGSCFVLIADLVTGLLKGAVAQPRPACGSLCRLEDVPAANRNRQDEVGQISSAVAEIHCTSPSAPCTVSFDLRRNVRACDHGKGGSRMSSQDDQPWPAGMAGYDLLKAKSKRDLGKGEREAIAPHISDDEPVVGRHYAFEVSNQADGTLLKNGAVLVSTDRKLLLVSAQGTFRPKFTVKTFNYAQLMPGVGNTDGQFFGNPAWYSGFRLQSARESYVVQFFTPEERDEFVRDVGGALGGWHIIHGNA